MILQLRIKRDKPAGGPVTNEMRRANKAMGTPTGGNSLVIGAFVSGAWASPARDKTRTVDREPPRTVIPLIARVTVLCADYSHGDL